MLYLKCSCAISSAAIFCPALIIEWSTEFVMAVCYLGQLPGYISDLVRVRKLPVTWGSATCFVRYSAFPCHSITASPQYHRIGEMTHGEEKL